MRHDFGTNPYCERKITQSEYDYIFVSPHLDDVVLSCSGAICALKERANIMVITLFAGDPHPPFSPLAQAFHRLWNAPGAAPYAQRKEEERQAMALLGVDYAWLNWLEILYRNPSLARDDEICDPTVKPEHDPLFSQICDWFIALASAFPTAHFIVPLAIGTHRDHVITRQAACHAIDQRVLRFYEDFPYAAFHAQEIPSLARTYSLAPRPLDISPFLEQRIQATLQYQSQLDMLCHPPRRIEESIRAYTQRQEESVSFIETYWMKSDSQFPFDLL